MDYMPWMDDYSVGVASIDAQHKHLVGMINGMKEVLSRGSKSDEVAALLDDLLEYTDSHFAFEEGLMAKAAYEELNAHKEKHTAMKAEVRRLLAQASNGNVVVPLTLMQFLRNWLARHIMVTDKAYASALKKAGIT